jgi:hypothetical protein
VRAILLPALLAAACAHPGTDGSVIRRLDGEGTVIAADWSASEDGEQFAPVKDGTPQKPWISSAHASGKGSIAFSVPTDESGQKQRVEYKIAQAADADGLHFDNDRWVGFAFKLGASPAPFEGTAIFWQAWQGYPWGPPVSLKLVRGAAPPYEVRLAIRNTSVGPDSSVPDIEVWRGAIIQPDTWVRFMVHVVPRFASDGEVTLWVDDAEVVDWHGPIGYDPAAVAGAYNGLDLKNGIYQPTANQGHTFYLDDMVVGTSYDAVAAVLGW